MFLPWQIGEAETIINNINTNDRFTIVSSEILMLISRKCDLCRKLLFRFVVKLES
jgi:hypothetical protein